MDELFHNKDLFGGDSSHSNDAKQTVEVIPEMLDFDFVNERCHSIHELQAILHSLETGEFGKFSQLEQCVRAKLDTLLGKSNNTTPSKPTIERSGTIPNERESLLDWLGEITNETSGDTTFSNAIPPVRATTHTDLSNAIVVPKPSSSSHSEKKTDTHADDTPTAEKKASPSSSTKKTDTQIVFRKEKLSTKVERFCLLLTTCSTTYSQLFVMHLTLSNIYLSSKGILSKMGCVRR